MELLIEYLKTFPLEMGKGIEMGKSTYAMGGVVTSIHVHTIGGSNFCHFRVYVLIE